MLYSCQLPDVPYYSCSLPAQWPWLGGRPLGWKVQGHSLCSGPVSLSSLGRQRHLCLSRAQSFCMCLSPDGRQLGLCGGQYAFMSQSKHLLALIIQLGEEEEEDCGTSTALSPDRVSQAWGADMHTANRKWPVGLETPALPGSAPATSLSPCLPPMRSR